MAFFDEQIETKYVEALRAFLAVQKKGFLKGAGLVQNPSEKQRRGRNLHYPTDSIVALEFSVNEKSRRCEAADTTFSERYLLARDYQSMSNAQVGRALNVSRELARRWGKNINRPTCTTEIANLFKIPEAWLTKGNEINLPANSHIGVRVGDEAEKWREQLYILVLGIISELPDEANVIDAQKYIEQSIMTRPLLAQAARRAGGQWKILGGKLSFREWNFTSTC
jgi:hypothetical protein